MTKQAIISVKNAFNYGFKGEIVDVMYSGGKVHYVLSDGNKRVMARKEHITVIEPVDYCELGWE